MADDKKPGDKPSSISAGKTVKKDCGKKRDLNETEKSRIEAILGGFKEIIALIHCDG